MGMLMDLVVQKLRRKQSAVESTMKSNVPFEQRWKRIPSTKVLLNIYGLGKYTCRESMNGDVCEQWQRSIHSRMMNFNIETQMEN